MTATTSRKVSYTLYRPAVNIKFYPPITNGRIPSLHEQMAHALVYSAYRAAIRRAGNHNIDALRYAYIDANNIDDNAHIAYLAYTQALAHPTYDKQSPCVPVSPRRAAYRALSRHIYANKARSVLYNPDIAYSVVMQGTSFDIVARERDNFDALARDVLATPIATAYLKKHPNRRKMLRDMLECAPASHIRAKYGVGSSTITAARDMLRKAYAQAFND